MIICVSTTKIECYFVKDNPSLNIIMDLNFLTARVSKRANTLIYYETFIANIANYENLFN